MFRRLKSHEFYRGAHCFEITNSLELRRELHRIAPLRHVLDALALVDLVDQFRRMIHQPHGRFARHPDPPQPVDVGDAQAVKRQVRFLDLDEKLLPAPRWLERKFQREFLPGLDDAFKQWPQRRRHRHRERAALPALRRAKRDFVFHQVNATERNPRLAQPAARVQGNIKRDLHPFRFLLEQLADLADFRVGQFRFLRRLVPLQFQTRQRIGIHMTEPHRLAHDHGERLQFKNRRVAPDRLAGLFLVGRPPVNVFQRVAVSDGARRMKLLGLQPKRQPLPAVQIAFQRERTFAVPFQKFRHPIIPAALVERTAGAGQFLHLGFGAQRPRLDRVAGIIRPVRRGFVAPFSVAVNVLDGPKRRPFFLVD